MTFAEIRAKRYHVIDHTGSRVVGQDSSAHVIGRSGDLLIAEAHVAGTMLEGKTLANSKVRSLTGLSVIGVWDHGRLASVEPHTMILRHMVLSSASMGANTIFNLLRESDHLLLAEGVSLFPVPGPHSMQGRRLADCAVRSETGCTIIAVETEGEQVINPDPEMILPHGGQMLLIGTLEAEEKFLREFRQDVDEKTPKKRWKKRED